MRSKAILQLILAHIISEPTRITKSTATLIDHVYTSRKSFVAECGVANMHISDHCAVYCAVSNGRNERHPKRLFAYHSIRRVNQDALHENIRTQP